MKSFISKWLSGKRIRLCISGLICGILNGLLGAGGGMVIVPALVKNGVETKKAHATSVCVILPICVLSAAIYIFKGKVSIGDCIPYLPFGVVGSILGGKLLQKLKSKAIRRIFGALMMFAAIKMLF